MSVHVSQHYEIVYCPLEGSAHLYRGQEGEKNGGMCSPANPATSRAAAEEFAVGFVRAGQWEFRYNTFWVAEVRKIMAPPPVTLHRTEIPKN